MAVTIKDALAELLSTQDGDGAFPTPIPGLAIMRSSKPVMPNHRIYRPALCLVLQGAKSITLGEATLSYGEGEALVVAMEVPALGSITQASATKPYIGMTLEFDIAILRDVMTELDDADIEDGPRLGVFVQDVDQRLADCVLRLVRLIDTPRAIPVLFPAIMREISYWLLTGPNAGELYRLAVPDGHARRLGEALHLLRTNFSRPVRMEELAEAAGMSLSSFYKHFKTLTSMTPLQYQKQLRLLEARRLMQNRAANVAGAAYRVGYESASQFSREYARMFGAPPKRDVAQSDPAPAY